MEDIGVVSSVAEGVSMLIESIDWRPGDNAVLDENEHASVIAPLLFAGAAEVAARLRRTPEGEPGGRPHQADRHEPCRLPARCARRSARPPGARRPGGGVLVVDHAQAAGTMPLAAAIGDFAFAATCTGAARYDRRGDRRLDPRPRARLGAAYVRLALARRHGTAAVGSSARAAPARNEILPRQSRARAGLCAGERARLPARL